MMKCVAGWVGMEVCKTATRVSFGIWYHIDKNYKTLKESKIILLLS